MNNHPHLEVITGPMFSGKSTELLRRLTRAKIANKRTLLIRPDIDTTKITHNDSILIHETCIVAITNEFWPLIGDHFPYDVVGIDEVQFFNHISWIESLADQRIVIVAGLDTTFSYRPFGKMPQLMALAETVDKLTAVCVVCGNDATRTQRIIGGKPARRSDPVVLVGEDEFYEARCASCFEILD